MTVKDLIEQIKHEQLNQYTIYNIGNSYDHFQKPIAGNYKPGTDVEGIFEESPGIWKVYTQGSNIRKEKEAVSIQHIP